MRICRSDTLAPPNGVWLWSLRKLSPSTMSAFPARILRYPLPSPPQQNIPTLFPQSYTCTSRPLLLLSISSPPPSLLLKHIEPTTTLPNPPPPILRSQSPLLLPISMPPLPPSCAHSPQIILPPGFHTTPHRPCCPPSETCGHLSSEQFSVPLSPIRRFTARFGGRVPGV